MKITYLIVIAIFLQSCFLFKKQTGNNGKPPIKPPIDTVVIVPDTSQFYWPDRRPLGMVMVANQGTIGLPNYMTSDFSGFAKQCVRYMKEVDAQGCIIWDSEGQGFSHPYVYYGDPRYTPYYVDTIFDEIRKAGFRVGVTLRPDSIVWTGGWPHHYSTSAMRNLISKIDYAVNRWGCSVFYVDSNVDIGIEGVDNTIGAGQPIQASIFKKLNQLYPACLFIPEHRTLEYFKYSAPLNSHNTYHTTPEGFQVMNIADNKWSDQQLIESVKQGNILMGRVWWNSPELQTIKRIYNEK